MSGSNILAVELSSLKSIFENDVYVDGDTVVIRVHPLQNDSENDDAEAQIDLLVKCSENYPEVLPEISFKNSKGLSTKKVNILTSELETLTNSLKGQPMIYDLACYVLEYLVDNIKPCKKSFYDQMILRKEQEQAKFKSDEDRRIRKIHDVQQKVLMRIGENDSSEDEEYDSKLNFSSPNKKQIQTISYSFENEKDKIVCNPAYCNCSKYIQFQNKILRGCCIDHDECSTLYCALDTTTGEQLKIREWNLKSNQFDEIEKILKSIQNELNYLKKLNHDNLNSFIDFKSIIEKDGWIVYITEKYVSNLSLKTLSEQNWIFDLDFIRYIADSILKAVLYLHNHKVVHRQLNEANIYLNKSGKIKIANYGVKKRMDDLFRLCSSGIASDSKEKTDQKNDIWHLGLILNNLMGLRAKSVDFTILPNNKTLEFKDFIEKCLIKNEEKRWGARELMDHKFLKNSLYIELIGKRRMSYSKLNFDFNDEVQEPFDFSFAEQNSRLSKDFCILEDVGKGSFGKVLKVRNKLDGQIYAIKEIKLDNKNKQLDKKIVREVKLLSKLKHENVVRYYTSWIESYSDQNVSEMHPAEVTSKEAPNKINDCEYKSSVSEANDRSNDSDDEDDEDDEDNDFWRENDVEDESSFIVFQEDTQKEIKYELTKKKDVKKLNMEQPIRIMYIQMEFCEKSTLKFAIKNNLHKEEIRCWRLLKEIVEGLTYIHEQGLIHRDLKPDNIFLDHSDHVKIGDFGLAKIREVSMCASIITAISLGKGDNETYFIHGDSDTTGVGTSYYVAPEVNKVFDKSRYNEKVDIYSLGIIFFEMCHPPFDTAMERHEVLMKLKKTEIVIPTSSEDQMPLQMTLVRMLLNRDPASRPSSREILDDYIPPAEVEFEELKEIVRKTLLSPETKSYRYLISSCLNQKISIDDDITYSLQNSHSEKFCISLEMAKEPIESIFKKHGAIFLSTPLLLPQNDIYGNFDVCVKLMTQSGAIVNLPYDLRVPFARFIVLKKIRRIRRYTIDKVHKEHKVHSALPKEIYECAFDIVSPEPGNLLDEWEMLIIMDEIVNSFPSLKNRNCTINLNHSLIFRSLLIYCNVEKFYSEIFRFLVEAKMSKYAKKQLETNLLSLQLGIRAVEILVTYFAKEETVYCLKEELLSLFQHRPEAYEKAAKGFDKLIKIIEEGENFGINIPIKIRLGVVCNTEHCSDIMFDLVCKTKQKREKQITETIISGCRYDGLLHNFRKLYPVMNLNIKEPSPCAIGINISLDKIASLLKEDNVLSECVVVCSTDSLLSNKAKNLFIKELRECRIKCYFEDAIDSMEELMEYCGESKIAHIVNLKEENGLVLVMSYDISKCRYKEKKMSKREVAEYILKNSKFSDDQNITNYSRLEIKASPSEISSVNQSISIHIMSEEKSLTRRKYENQIRSKISSLPRYFSSKIRIEILGVELDEEEISRLAMFFKHEDNSYLPKILSIADREKCGRHTKNFPQTYDLDPQLGTGGFTQGPKGYKTGEPCSNGQLNLEKFPIPMKAAISEKYWRELRDTWTL